MAKTLFSGKQTKKQWPLLDRMLSCSALNYVDFMLAKHLQAESEAVAALICHLSLAIREGHLCIQINEHINPTVEQLWTGDEDLSLSDKEALTALIHEGSCDIPKVQTHVAFVTDPVISFDDLFYFQRYWMQETAVLAHFQQLQKTEPKIKINPEQLKRHVGQLTAESKLLPEQAEAILKAASQSVTLICGGPGTGKTYTAGILLKLLLESCEGPCEIALAAPTGKAAANLQKSMMEGLEPAKTLHSLLGIGKRGIPQPLSADLVLIDESSMIDAQLMDKLLAAVKPGARLIFLGDRNQLPPVEAGSFFADMIDASPNSSVFLKTCLRAELKEIIEVADRINQGDDEAFLKMLNQGSAVKRFSEDPFSLDRFPSSAKDPQSLLQTFNQFRLLSPLRKGPYGVEKVNQTILSHCMQQRIPGRPFVVPIMLCRNDSRLNLFNGEVGVLVRQSEELQGGDYALFPSKDRGVRQVPAMLLPQYEYAYCLSVHKSQGSEFDHVLLLMPEGAQVFGREVLYTAATRARKSLQIYGSDDVLRQTLQVKGNRLSGFTKRYSWM